MSTERKAVKHKPSSQASPGLLKRLPITAPPGCGLMTDHYGRWHILAWDSYFKGQLCIWAVF